MMASYSARPNEWQVGSKMSGEYPLAGTIDIRALLIVRARSIINEAATASPVQPIINMGQGFLCV